MNPVLPLRRARLPLLLGALTLGTFAPVAAQAGQVEAAEHVRVSEEMRKLAQRGNWGAVEDQFKVLEGLESKGEPLTVSELELGAKAARTLGNIAAAYDRLQRGAKAGGSPEIIQSLDEINANFGPARINVDPKYIGDRVLTAKSALMLPEEFAAVSYANSVLVNGSFDGLLPKGDYTVANQSFSVAAGGAASPVTLAPDKNAPKQPFSLAWAGPRVSAGVAYTQGGAVSADTVTPEGGPQAVPFGGVGARVGVGVDVGLSKHLGVLAEVGYHDLFGASASGGGGDSLHLGYGWLAASARFGNVWVAAGPVWGIGAASVEGIDAACLDGVSCGDVGALDADTASLQRLSGTVTAGGGAASLALGLFDVGGLRGGLELSGGAQTDTFRWYPWGELGFALAPATRRD